MIQSGEARKAQTPAYPTKIPVNSASARIERQALEIAVRQPEPMWFRLYRRDPKELCRDLIHTSGVFGLQASMEGPRLSADGESQIFTTAQQEPGKSIKWVWDTDMLDGHFA